MRKLLIALGAMTLVTAACKKEVSLEDPAATPGGGGNTAGQLTRMVQVAGNDSLAYNFSYNPAGRLTLVSAVAPNYLETIRFDRNAGGIITQIVLKNTGLLAAGIDSVVTRYNYNAAKGGYTSGVFELDLSGATYIDSTEFIYTGGNLISRVSYAGGTGVPFEEASKLEYTHAGVNLNSVKSFSHTGTAWDLDYTINYAFDSKTNPIRMGVETLLIDPYLSPAFGLNSSIYYGANNATLIDYIDPNDPADSYKITTTYTYNSADKPAAGTVIETPGNYNSAWRFYYN